jgi:DNA-binding transcriptional MocR family regulator
MSVLPPLSRLSTRLRPSGIRELEQLAAARPGLISLGPGQPDASLFDLNGLLQRLGQPSARPGTDARYLQYGPSAGDPRLVAQVVGAMQAQGIACDASHVLVTSGSQQGLDLVCQLLLDEGDAALVQPCTYPGALQVFRTRGARVAALSSPPAGDEKLIYAMVDFQNPTGERLDLAARQALVALARQRSVYLVEDAPYRELAFDGIRLPSLMAIDLAGRSPDEGRTIFLGSFSKSVAPGLRLGWVVGPSALIARLTLLRQASDLQPSTLSQALLADLLEEDPAGRLARLRRRYRERRDALEAALERHLGGQARWQRPEGGFFFWVRLDAPLDTRALLPLAIEQGVAYVPGSECCVDGRGGPWLRLSYSAVEPLLMGEAVARLARAIGVARQLAGC